MCTPHVCTHVSPEEGARSDAATVTGSGLAAAAWASS